MIIYIFFKKYLRKAEFLRSKVQIVEKFQNNIPQWKIGKTEYLINYSTQDQQKIQRICRNLCVLLKINI